MYACRGTVAMGLIHEEDEVVTASQIVKVALADVFGQPLDAGRSPTAHFGVDLGDVEDIDLHTQELVKQGASFVLVVIPGDDLRWLGGELRNALEDTFWSVGRKVRDQLVVDRQVWRQDEKVVDAVCQV